VRRLFQADKVRLSILFAAFAGRTFERILSTDDLMNQERDIALAIDRIKRGDFAPPAVPCRNCPNLPDGCALAVTPL
jgi:hypothetical protein